MHLWMPRSCRFFEDGLAVRTGLTLKSLTVADSILREYLQYRQAGIVFAAVPEEFDQTSISLPYVTLPIRPH